MTWLLEGSGALASKPGKLFWKWASPGTLLPRDKQAQRLSGPALHSHLACCPCSPEGPWVSPPLGAWSGSSSWEGRLGLLPT